MVTFDPYIGLKNILKFEGIQQKDILHMPSVWSFEFTVNQTKSYSKDKNNIGLFQTSSKNI